MVETSITSPPASSRVATLLPAPPPQVNPWSVSSRPLQQHLNPSKNESLPLSVTSSGAPTVTPEPHTAAKAKKSGKEKWVPLEAQILVSSPIGNRIRSKNNTTNTNGTSVASSGSSSSSHTNGKKKKDLQAVSNRSLPSSNRRNNNNKRKPGGGSNVKNGIFPPSVETKKEQSTAVFSVAENSTPATTSELSSGTTEATDVSDEKNIVRLVSQLNLESAPIATGESAAPPTSDSIRTLESGYPYSNVKLGNHSSSITNGSHSYDNLNDTIRFKQPKSRNSMGDNNFRYHRKGRNSFSRNSNGNINQSLAAPYQVLSPPPYYVPYFVPQGPLPPFNVSSPSSRRNSQRNSPGSNESSPINDNNLTISAGSHSNYYKTFGSSSQQQPFSPPPQIASPPPVYMDPNMYYGVFSLPTGIPQPSSADVNGSPQPFYQPYYGPPPPGAPPPPPPPGFGLTPIIPQQPQYAPPQYLQDQMVHQQEESVMRLVRQIEYYFSVENLLKDLYLRKHMDSDGYVGVPFIANFSRVKTLSGGDYSLISQALKRIDFLHVSGSGKNKKVKLKQGWETWVLPPDQRDESLQ